MLVQHPEKQSLSHEPNKAEFIEHFEMDHLLSLTGLLNTPMDPNEGLQRLKQRKSQNGVSPLRCIVALIVRHNRKEIIVKNPHSGEELEVFPLRMVSTIFFHRSLDPHEVYNNKVMIILSQSPRNLHEMIPEMHIFQAVRISADEVVQRVNEFKVLKLSPEEYPPLEVDEAPIQQHVSQSQKSSAPKHLNSDKSGHQQETSSQPIAGRFMPTQSKMAQNEAIGHSVDLKSECETYLLNRCMDDIEKFVFKLQKAVRVYKDVKERLSKSARKAKSKEKLLNYSMAMHTQLPSSDEYVECFKLFKLAFNLLARIDNTATTPSPADILHALFNNLEPILNSSRDPKTKQLTLAQSVASPLLSSRAIEFLHKTLSDQEKNIWRSLGETWNTSREMWKGPFVPSYLPVFSDGFTPTLWDYDEEIFTEHSTVYGNGKTQSTSQHL